MREKKKVKKVLNQKTVFVVTFVVFVFFLAFSLGVQAYANSLPTPYELEYQNWLQENYGVISTEELMYRFEQEAWRNYTETLQQLPVGCPEWKNEFDWQLPSRATSAYQEKPSTQPLFQMSHIGYVNPFTYLSVFSTSGLAVLSLMFVPFVKKRKWLKYTVVLSFLALVFFSIGFYAGQVYASGSTITITEDSFVDTASYVIFKDDSTIKAKNGETGEIDYSGSNAVTVINDAIDDLSSGGVVYIKQGNYDISTNLLVTQNDVTLIFSSGAYLTKTADTSMLVVGHSDGSATVSHITIAGGEFDGASASVAGTSCAIIVYKAVDVVIRDVYIHDQDGAGVEFSNTQPSQDVEVLNCYIDGTGKAGAGTYGCAIALRTVTDGVVEGNIVNDVDADAWGAIEVSEESTNVTVSGNVVSNATGSGIEAEVDAENVTIADNMVYSCVQGIIVYKCAGTDVKYVSISGNIIHTTSKHGIFIAYAYYVSVVGNVIYNVATDGGSHRGMVVDHANYATISGNIIYLAQGDYAVYIKNSDYSIFSDNVIVEPTTLGLGNSYSDHTIISNNIVKDITHETYGKAIDVDHSNWVTVSGNNIYDAVLRGIVFTTVSNSIISNNIIDTTTQGIELLTNSDNNLITGNNINATTWDIRVSDATMNDNVVIDNVIVTFYDGGTGTKVRHNLGYVTENFGTATILNTDTSVTVAHGLATTPTIVTVTGTHSEVSACWVTGVNATHFVINVANAVSANRDVYWYAEV